MHGANRLGSNSLIDLVVFGRAAAIRAGEVIDRASAIPQINASASEKILERFDRIRYADGSQPTAELREKMQRTMQEDAAVFRTQESLEQGCQRISAIWGELPDVKVSDRSLIWNSDLMETLELENLMANAITKGFFDTNLKAFAGFGSAIETDNSWEMSATLRKAWQSWYSW